MLIQNLCASEHKQTFFSVLGLGLIVVCLSEFLGIKFYRKRSDAANDPLVINTKDSSRLTHHAESHFRLFIHLSKQRQSFPSCLATAGGKSFN